MKRSIQAAVLILWLVVASGLLTRFWLVHPDLFPAFPKPIAEYLVALYGARNAEEVADLEILTGLSISLPIVSALTYLAYTIWHKVRSS